MASEKATAIVLRVVDFSETSAVVSLFSREFGKVRGLAKGARRPKGPFESALDLLAEVRIVFLHKTSDTLDLLTEAKLIRRFRPAGRDLGSLYAGYYVAELLAELTDDYDPHPELFDAAQQTLAALTGGDPVAETVLRFELAALRQLGHLPSLELCVECGKQVAGEGRVAFSQIAGGVLCPKCRTGKSQVVSVSPSVIEALRKFAADSELGELRLPRNVRGELRAVLNNYLYALLGRKLRVHEYLGSYCT
jgi:DNA repair protein RecO (recombination protein O)